MKKVNTASKHFLFGAGLSIAVFGFSGCSSVKPVKEAAKAPPKPELQVVEKRYDRPFETDTLYALLVAEFAGERKRFDVMLNNYVQQAYKTNDLEVITRAARIARFLNEHEDSLAMAKLWVEQDPDNLEANYNAAAELVSAAQLEEAFIHAKKLLQGGEKTGFDAIGARAMQINDTGVSKRLLTEYQALLKDYPEDHSLLMGLSFLAQHTEQFDLALETTRKALALEPDSFQAAGQETRLLHQMGRAEEAINKMGDLVDNNPENARLRLQYARSLMKSNLPAAQEQLKILLQQNPADEDIRLTLALVQFELQQFDDAKANFSPIENSAQHRSVVNYYLGRIAQFQKNEETAIAHFKRVDSGKELLPSIANLVDLYNDRGQSQEALKYIQNLRQSVDDQPEQSIGLYLLESQVHSKSGHYEKALKSLDKAIAKHADSTRLLYGRAMLLAQMDDVDSAERDLKKVLSIEPNNAAALNALGYTLVDKTDRIDEAYDYIKQAYTLDPSDPAIIDSMGWVEYLRGNTELALDKLLRAMKAYPDHEIAAHLGEVLWVSGKKEEAQTVWQEGLQLKPDSPVIKKTLERLGVEL